MNKREIEHEMNVLFDELVPATGKADTVAGEIVRATMRIAYRNWNDGDHIGVGYGKETCNAPARYLLQHCNDAVKQAVNHAWGLINDEQYDETVLEIESAVIEFIESNPQLKESANYIDMWDLINYREDRDDSWDDDEDYWD